MSDPVVVCLKAGIAYSIEYVNRLHAMVERHLTVPHRFVCLTDDSRGIAGGIEIISLEEPGLWGWWHKLALFNPPAGLENRRLVFLDLDTVVTGPVDFLLDYQGPFAILRDFYHPQGYGSAIMSIAPGYGRAIWGEFAERPREIMARLSGDQEWIRTCVDGADLWQELYPGKIVSYKVHCGQGIPEGAAIVCFHGVPKPPDLPADDRIRGIWEGACTFSVAEAGRPA